MWLVQNVRTANAKKTVGIKSVGEQGTFEKKRVITTKIRLAKTTNFNAPALDSH